MINWASHFYRVFPQPGFESMTVTCIENTRKTDIGALNKSLRERGMLISMATEV